MKNYFCYIYKFETRNKNPNQIDIADKFENGFANIFERCLGNRITFEFDEVNIAVFEKLYIDNNCFLGLYGCAPAKTNTYVNNRDYNTFDITKKNEASTIETIFYVDFAKMCVLLVDIKGIIGFPKNLEKAMLLKKIKITPARFKGWKKYVEESMSEINSITIKERNFAYEPRFSKLNKNKYVYVNSKFNVKMTIKDFINEMDLTNIDETFETLSIEGQKDGKTKIIDAVLDEIRAKKEIVLDNSCFNNITSHVDILLDSLRKLSLLLIFDGNILLK